MPKNTTSSKKQSNYNSLEHGKLLSEIIARMSNNHTKWIFTLFTVIGFSLTIDKFILDISGIVKIIAWSLITLVIFIILNIAMKVSRMYFKLENAYRDKQKKVLNGEFSEYTLTPDINSCTKDKSWIITSGTIIIWLYLLTQILIILIYQFT